MIRDHARMRMRERKITQGQMMKCLSKGTASADLYGRPWVRKVTHCNIVVIVDIVDRDILTTWKLDAKGNKIT